jgi:phosphatidylinositol alpha-1,6-mannosyltransferase
MSNITLKDTNTEGFGIVFLEANACGKPVIGGNAGGVPDAIKNRYNGFLVDSNNIDQISEKVITLLKDKNLNKRMGKDAIQWAKKFSYSKLMNQFLETIK